MRGSLNETYPNKMAKEIVHRVRKLGDDYTLCKLYAPNTGRVLTQNGKINCKKCKEIEKLEIRIKDLKERVESNNQDIEFGEDKDFKKISLSDNVVCKKWLKEAEKELDALRGSAE